MGTMVNDLLKSGLLKDRHNINTSAGILSDLLRSGLPNDESYLIVQTQSKSMLSGLLRSGLLNNKHNSIVFYPKATLLREFELW